MSYILEALRKSERERQSAESPSLPALVAEQPPRRQSWGVWALAFLLGLNLLILAGVWLVDRHGNHASPPQVTQSAVSAPSPSTVAATNSQSPPASGSPSVKQNPPPAPPSVVQRDVPTVPVAKPKYKSPAVKPGLIDSGEPPRRPANVGGNSDAKRGSVDGQEDGIATVAAPPVSRTRSMSGIESSAKESERDDLAMREPLAGTLHEESDAVAQAKAIPFLNELPVDIRQRIPQLKISLYAYSAVPAERFVIVNGKRYEVGQSLPGGADLLEIRADSMVLSLDGTRFQIPRP